MTWVVRWLDRIAVTALLMSAACGLFDTRDVVPPEVEGERCTIVDAIRPALALRNMEQAFECGVGGGGATTYERSITEDFDFNAAVVEDQVVRQFFDDWEQSEPRQEALSAFTQQLNTAPGVTAILTIEAQDEDELSYEDGFLFDDTGYTLIFATSTDTTARFGGQGDIYVKDPGSGFAIYRWDDSESASGLPTLGRFWYEGTSAGETGK